MPTDRVGVGNYNTYSFSRQTSQSMPVATWENLTIGTRACRMRWTLTDCGRMYCNRPATTSSVRWVNLLSLLDLILLRKYRPSWCLDDELSLCELCIIYNGKDYQKMTCSHCKDVPQCERRHWKYMARGEIIKQLSMSETSMKQSSDYKPDIDYKLWNIIMPGPLYGGDIIKRWPV